ncbi:MULTISPECIES: VWA domain-containing protein [Clostridium]|uniref:VWA domain-containing protein n=1 Tax=Clostridium TaxID=1485 RepID=UPI00115AEF04|nr:MULTISPECIES: VWA domain-containing protein [Clostridium]MBS5307883.1 VWA domain-containing protein [Clostridium sp.]MDB1933640.1 VWA domain-containing protein [Clostridium tertium]MDB1936151.1 VWA domain-containing protein [Clostridium tertium]MDB1945383.1 VWA domain-containing protein [Clostridium tertium]MDB1952217.1 VWA domain-containing protein [Clostridium tertium]
MKIEIGNLYFLILIPIIFAFMYYSFKKYKPWSKNEIAIFISRIVIFTLLILAFGNITINLKGRNISTVFLLDVSESAGDFEESGKDFISTAIESMPRGNKAGVVLFGDDSKIDKVLNKKKEYKSIDEKPVVTATNIQEAVESALGLFERGGSKRIVLITDGEENQGDILKSIPLINEQKIDFKVYKITGEKGEEIYVDNVKVPDNISVGEEFSVSIDIKSNYATKAKLTLFSGRNKVGEQQVQIQKGKNSFVFKDKQSSGGFKGYRVLVEAEGDTNKVNNEFSTFTNVMDKPNILLINGIKGDSEALEEILSNSGANIKKIAPSASPSTLNELLEYKSIVLNDVHRDDLNNGFMDNIEAYVKDYGGGLITFGGEDSYALGGYKDTSLEKVLPVYMDKRGKNEVPAISINLIIDKSGSMSAEGGGVSKLTLAKEAAMKALENLREVDEISVIAFDDTYDEVVPLQKVGDKEAIKELISGIQIRGGTSIYPALEQGYNMQMQSSAKIKHTILLTDGQDGYELDNYATLLQNFIDNNITLSTVAVGEGANAGLLNQLASIGKGRSYYTDIYTDIPRIFAKEVLLSAGTYIINEEFTPKILSNHEILAGVKTSDGIPSLLGYIGTSIKENAVEILSSNHDEPILAAMQYGIGRTVSFTSDVSGQWSKNYLAWEYGPQLIKNMVYFTIPKYGEEGKLNISQEGNEAKVEFYNDKISKDAKVKGIYNGENGEEGEFELSQVEPGKFEASIPLDSLGFYNFSIREEESGEVKNNYKGAFALQYSDEYKFNTNGEKLDVVVKETKGSFINKPEEVFEGKLQREYKKINLTTPLIVISILLFMLDIAYRRLNIDLVRFFKKRKDKVKKEKIAKNTNSIKNNEVKIKEEKKAIKENIISPENSKGKNKINTKISVEADEQNLNKENENKGKIIKEKGSKRSKKNLEKEVPKKESLDTSVLLKKKSDRKKI